ncbi:MAG: heavy metal sensor histidine kinase [Burkholderiales bacterium]|nr:heavy metal sensor histidine kinase [Burkholderiales bacterium]
MALRLAATTGVAGMLLACALAAFLYWTLARELDQRAREELAGKLQRVAHSVAEARDLAALVADDHALRDVMLGHENLHLALTRPDASRTLIGYGAAADATAERFAGRASATVGWPSPAHGRMLSLVAGARTLAGDEVMVHLTLARRADDRLLGAVSRGIAVALPGTLLLIAAAAWLGTRRGLRPLTDFRALADAVSTRRLGSRLVLADLPEELEQTAAAFNTMLSRLDEGVARLSEFSADLAHELRNPLANLMGKTQVALSQARSAPEYRAVLESNAEEFERLARLVDDMLFLARSDRPGETAGREHVDLAAEAARLIEYFAPLAEEAGVGMDVAGSATVVGDRTMLQRALSNLLSNALRYTPPGGRIGITIADDAGSSTLAVENPGEGIAAEHLPRLFERFYRVDAARSRAEGGTGLGLAIVRTIMTLHGGVAEVASSPHGPTRFTLRFPRGGA